MRIFVGAMTANVTLLLLGTVQSSREEREIDTEREASKMASIAWFCCSSSSSTPTPTLSSRSSSILGSSSLVVETHPPRTLVRKAIRRTTLYIKAQVDFVNAEEATKLVAEGYTVLDVRDRTQYERAHIKSCKHVPLFIENKDNDPGTIIKRQLHNNFSGLFYGLPFTKPNPEFVQSVKSQFSPDSKMLVVCQEGLRSAAAAEKLDASGFQNVACMTSGLQSVKPGSFDSVGSTELQNAGKAGLVTVQGKISAALGTVLVCAYLFITFFPDQAEKILALFPSA